MRVTLPRKPLAVIIFGALLVVASLVTVLTVSSETAYALNCPAGYHDSVNDKTKCQTTPSSATTSCTPPATFVQGTPGRVILSYCQIDPLPDGQQATPVTCDTANGEFVYNNTCAIAPDANGGCPKYTPTGSTDPRGGGGLLCVKSPANSNNDTASNTGATTDSKTAGESDLCPIEANKEFRWLYCPLFTGMFVLTNTMDSFINEYLTTGNVIYTPQSEPSYKQAWSTFRTFGLALVIIAGLVMLISEAFGLQIIDAYTVRKVLPRLLVAVIGIAVSWQLCKFMISLFDDLGQAMGSIIYSSFGITTPINIAALIATNLLAAGGVAVAAVLLQFFGILTLVGTLLIGMLIGAVVLILRQAIIVAAVLLAPLAIAAYILPNTNKFARFWWDTLLRMLMLYPIATGLIALCKVLGKIAMGL